MSIFGNSVGAAVPIDKMLPLDGSKPMTGDLNMNGQKITGLNAPTADDEAANKKYVDEADKKAVKKSGDTMTGLLGMSRNRITGLGDPVENSDAVSKSYVDTEVSGAKSYVDTEVSGAKSYVDTEVSGAKSYADTRVGHNLLDNSDFTNPVNQRGASSYTPTSSSYWLDRWYIYGTDATFTLNEKKVKITNGGQATCGIYQRIEEKNLNSGKVYTLAVKAKISGQWRLSYGIDGAIIQEVSDYLTPDVDKVHTFTFTLPASTNSMYHFRLSSIAAACNAEVTWAALYEGEYTAETLPEYQPKGYGAELAECHRYFLRINTNTDVPFPGFCTASAMKVSMLVGILSMRVAPTVIMSSNLLIVVRTINGYSSLTSTTGKKPTSAIVSRNGSMLCLYVDYDKEIATNNTPVVSSIISGYIEISADL